ncbi:MAG TPA: glutamate--tRNA ligase family protein [bacterium]|nr:glutamate--tRNA ligase family protein [bacterium]
MTVRFAPSPTGTFHAGNLRTAWISREWARVLSLPWSVRFENIDKPRNVPGARERQLEEMKRLGLVPDATALQSDSFERHWTAFLKFLEADLVYPCFCSRKMIRDSVDAAASAPHGPVAAYTGKCRDLNVFPKTTLPTLAWRVRREDATGRDDFVVARTGTALDVRGVPDKDTFAPAYHWACAVDDYDGDHALLVRAWDLEEAAGQQRFLHERLAHLEKSGKPVPAIFHCSLVTADDGHRLEKRTPGASLEEILDAGETPATLVEKFRRSFMGDWGGFEAGKIFGETRRTLALGELLGR